MTKFCVVYTVDTHFEADSLEEAIELAENDFLQNTNSTSNVEDVYEI